ncbi:MAG: DUF5658 family protein [Terriglobales bacterium]
MITFTSDGRRSRSLKGTTITDVLAARTSFIVLQALDLATTLIAFHFGAFEVNPLVAHLTRTFGPTGGVLVSKLAAVLIIFRVRKLMWVANLFYVGVVCWNIFVLLAFLHLMRH